MPRWLLSTLFCTALCTLVADIALLLFPPKGMNFTAIEAALAGSMVAVWWWGNCLRDEAPV